ncbi:F0F1 ATP synthase subunit A [Streptococcus didelphis]|uniref:ATP synthase subunit a n=2 Tax=Streptococcus didelphis TaxID=102886 RepID=A0ABY9LHP6_9STRE|nr:F0F1 ATP synthase subunit A [Streptococcus didelphis]WMB28379.1 F0F1 ATP synthase subunit A [Streptococcus didelphis]WMB29064.1 F0F1 ATP synthase subunit A [Streptococcus didelphis]
MEKLQNPTVQFLGIQFDLTILMMSLLTVLVAFIFIFWSSRHMTIKPKGKQNIIEWLFEFVQGITKQSLGKYNSNYSLLTFSLFFFIFVANNIGLLTTLKVGEFNYWTSPTANAAVDFGLALMVAIIVHFEGIRKAGIKEYVKEYIQPTPVMLPMNILEEFTNIISLTLRLFGNIYAGEVVLSLLLQFAHVNFLTLPLAFLLTMLWIAFSAFISGIQAYVFVLLTSTYIGKK